MSSEIQENASEHNHKVNIIVNGEPHAVSSRKLSFEEIVRLAFDDAVFNESIVYTVTYKRGPHQNREGTLVAGESVFVADGMIFNAKRTDKS